MVSTPVGQDVLRKYMLREVARRGWAQTPELSVIWDCWPPPTSASEAASIG
jgi:hypothetical protein